MERKTFDEIYMKLALDLSSRSTCSRLKVGCVITTEDHQAVLSIGYNGNYKGGPNACDSNEPGNCGCLHAEDNAIIKCYEGKSTKKIVYCSHLPCIMCAKRIVNLGGVTAVKHCKEYRKNDSIKVFCKSGIYIERITL